MSPKDDTHRAISRIWTSEQPRLIAGLTRMTRDASLAEELAQDALLVALRKWPETGVPTNPGAWLMQTAKRRAIDYFRHRAMARTKLAELGRAIDDDAGDTETSLVDALDDDVGDDLLRLIFTACHPILPIASRMALTLRLVGGLTTEEIARAFLLTEPTIGQRIVRAKRTIAEAGLAFDVPRGADRMDRIGTVLGVLYLIYNEGYSATAGDDLMRPKLCAEAIRLCRILTALAPEHAEAQALLALMEIQSSRTAARTDAHGQPVLLQDQDRSLWDQAGIARGQAALDRAHALGGAGQPYALQAAIAACHARAHHASQTNWPRIAALYGVLAVVTPSPVIELNRAVAISMAEGPAQALTLIDTIRQDPALQAYHLLYGVRGDILFKLGRFSEAAEEFHKAADLTRNGREKTYLLERAAAALA